MSTVAPIDRPSESAAATWRGRLFGVELEAAAPLPGLSLSANGSPARRTILEVVSAQDFERRWRSDGATRVVDRRYRDGRPMLTIDLHDDHGYRITWPGHGRHLVSVDGTRITSVLPELSPWRWHKFFFAVVLPLSAKLQGFELFHASAVAFRGRVVAFVAQSGLGKSSIAAHLVGGGAAFVSDDVIALERTQAGVLVHPAPPMASVTDAELRSMTPEGRERLGTVLGRSDKVHLATHAVDRPLPLAAVYFLKRRPDLGEFEVKEVRPADPRLLLASTFVPYLKAPAHQKTQLDVCAGVASSSRLFLAQIPSWLDAAQAARLIEEDVEHKLAADEL